MTTTFMVEDFLADLDKIQDRFGEATPQVAASYVQYLAIRVQQEAIAAQFLATTYPPASEDELLETAAYTD